MRILVVYTKTRFRDRRTITDHLYAFRHYVPDCRFLYLNLDKPQKLTESLVNTRFDAVIFHYTFLAGRFDQDWKKKYDFMREKLMRLTGVKVLLPHDEYIYTQAIWNLVRDCDAHTIYASCFPHDYNTIFPKEKLGQNTRCKTVLTGYVEERLLPRLARKARPLARRPKDVGYRALESTYTFGAHGQLKSQVAVEFMAALKRHPELEADVLLTYRGGVNTLYGNKWFGFLMSCKVGLGCLGGSSLLDADGATKARIDVYLKQHPKAGFDEVRDACYQDADGRIATCLLGPRHFESAMARTCQCLVEGDYHGVLRPGEHYIEVKRDFSNLEEVLAKMQDIDTCQQMADRCYKDVVLSGRYTYRQFANEIANDLRQAVQNTQNTPAVQAKADTFSFLCLRVRTALTNRYSPVKAVSDVLYRRYQWLRTYKPGIYRPLEWAINSIWHRDRV